MIYQKFLFYIIEFEEQGSAADGPESPVAMDTENLTDSNFQVF